MTADTIRMLGTYAIAVLTLAGCFVLLIFPSQVDQGNLLPFVTGVVGLVLGWVFNRESTAGGQRNAERAAQLGADMTNAGPTATVTTSAGPPATVKVTTP